MRAILSQIIKLVHLFKNKYVASDGLAYKKPKLKHYLKRSKHIKNTSEWCLCIIQVGVRQNGVIAEVFTAQYMSCNGVLLSANEFSQWKLIVTSLRVQFLNIAWNINVV